MIDLESLRAELDQVKKTIGSVQSVATIDVIERLCTMIHRIAFELHDAQSTIEAWQEPDDESDE